MKLIVFLSVISFAAAISVKFTDCGSSSSNIDIDVTPCSSLPCNLKHGTNYTVKISFTPAKSVQNIGVKIYGVVAGVPVPFPFGQPDACADAGSGLTCPLSAGTPVVYDATLPIKSEYPAIRLAVKWELVDNDTKDPMICAEIPVAVINGEHKVKDVRRLHWEE